MLKLLLQPFSNGDGSPTMLGILVGWAAVVILPGLLVGRLSYHWPARLIVSIVILVVTLAAAYGVAAAFKN